MKVKKTDSLCTVIFLTIGAKETDIFLCHVTSVTDEMKDSCFNLTLYALCNALQYYICSPTSYTDFITVEYLFTICLTARHVSDLQVHPQEHL